jgi:hypothetical protein
VELVQPFLLEQVLAFQVFMEWLLQAVVTADWVQAA